MSIHSGKPGSIRIRGLQRAQLQKTAKLVDSMVAYDEKLLAKTPPVIFLTAPQRTQFQAMAVTCEQLLDQKNT